ncbi:HAD family hydrolase [Mesorhizobium sp. M0174]|uniref:HAD family hydrolase n=1 Tax=Mesorhizobium sp. M0174 TaxID=2956904 RepID=UPI00333C1291
MVAARGRRAAFRCDRKGRTDAVHVAVDGKFAGVIFIADTLRPGAREALAKLRATGVKRMVMVTGDNEATAPTIANELGVDEVRANLMPQDKVTAIAELQKQGHRAWSATGSTTRRRWHAPMSALRWAAAARRQRWKRPTLH